MVTPPQAQATDAATRRVQEWLDEMNRAKERSDQIEALLHEELNCSRYELVDKYVRQFGPGNDHELYLAHKSANELLYGGDTAPPSKPFMVRTPI